MTFLPGFNRMALIDCSWSKALQAIYEGQDDAEGIRCALTAFDFSEAMFPFRRFAEVGTDPRNWNDTNVWNVLTDAPVGDVFGFPGPTAINAARVIETARSLPIKMVGNLNPMGGDKPPPGYNMENVVMDDHALRTYWKIAPIFWRCLPEGSLLEVGNEIRNVPPGANYRMTPETYTRLVDGIEIPDGALLVSDYMYQGTRNVNKGRHDLIFWGANGILSHDRERLVSLIRTMPPDRAQDEALFTDARHSSDGEAAAELWSTGLRESKTRGFPAVGILAVTEGRSAGQHDQPSPWKWAGTWPVHMHLVHHDGRWTPAMQAIAEFARDELGKAVRFPGDSGPVVPVPDPNAALLKAAKAEIRQAKRRVWRQVKGGRVEWADGTLAFVDEGAYLETPTEGVYDPTKTVENLLADLDAALAALKEIDLDAPAASGWPEGYQAWLEKFGRHFTIGRAASSSGGRYRAEFGDGVYAKENEVRRLKEWAESIKRWEERQ